jgi:hypothetical protein
MIQMPDLNPVLPYAALGLGLIALLILIGAFILLRSFIRSRVAAAIVIAVGVVLAGPLLAGAFSAIVNALVLGAIGVGVVFVAALIILRGNPDLQDLVRDLVPRRAEPPMLPPSDMPPIIDQPKPTTTAIQKAPRRARSDVRKDWGL